MRYEKRHWIRLWIHNVSAVVMGRWSVVRMSDVIRSVQDVIALTLINISAIDILLTYEGVTPSVSVFKYVEIVLLVILLISMVLQKQ